MKSCRWLTLSLLVALLLLPLSAQAAPQVKSVRMKYKTATLRAGQSSKMPIQVKPASGQVKWASSDETIASVTQNGLIRGLKPGKATISATATDAGGVSARCALTVKSAAITAITLSEKKASVPLSRESFPLTASVKPSAFASPADLRWSSSNKKIATVGQNGLVTLIRPGKVSITARAPSGKKASCALTVTRESAPSGIKGRALVVGYSKAVSGGSALPMVPSEVDNIARMFANRKIGGAPIATKKLLNGTRPGVLRAIESTFKGADADDVSYLYIICHGGKDVRGVYSIHPGSGGGITAAQLRGALNQIPGKVVLILGACQSGSVIGKGNSQASPVNEAADFLEQFLGNGAVSKSGELASDKFQVLCASMGTENGYGIVYLNNQTGQVMGGYNLFGRAVAEGSGWDLLAGRAAQWAADRNEDGALTLGELYAYSLTRVKDLYAEGVRDKVFSAGKSQTVTVFPANSSFVLFEQ